MNQEDKAEGNLSTVIPKYGLKVKLDHKYPEKRDQKYIPRIGVVWSMLPLIFRYLIYYLKSKWNGIKVVMDYVNARDPQQIYGVPIGGIGCGTIGRGFRGEFCRFQLRPGIYEWNTVDADQFIVTIKDENQATILQSLLSTFPKSSLSSWKSRIDGDKCHYTGLYPRAWIEYDLSDYGVYLTCRQISPVIPNDYANSCLPCAVFVWNVKNVCNAQRTVTIAFTFKNGTGNPSDNKATCSSKSFVYENSEGVILYNNLDTIQCTYALSAKTKSEISVSKCLYFDPKSNGSEVWSQLEQNGEFDKIKKSVHEDFYCEMAVGIASKVTVNASQSEEIELSLVWHIPTISFPSSKKTYNRYYTKQFGTDNAILKIVVYAFNNYKMWEQRIYEWQRKVLEDSKLPDWYKGALFNETYYISDGGTLWLLLDDEELKTMSENDPRIEYGRFAYLEGQEYIMYNSYDVHFYASHALHKNWPMLQKCLQYDLKDFVSLEIKENVKELYEGTTCERKKANSVPHDAGSPSEGPLTLVNAYPIHDVSTWRDLNSKFVLQTFRDAFASSPENPDIDYIKNMYDACFTVVQKTLKNDVDEDGLIKNQGIPDQTYDSWVMTGVSAYCGGLWLSALYGMGIMAEKLGKLDDKKLFENILNKAKVAFEKKMWNGRYYNFDCSTDHSKAIMADQLCGHWYLMSSGIKTYDIFPEDHVKTALKTIYKSNVELFCYGNMGAVNGIIEGQVDTASVQSVEVWTGVTYALAATMIYEGMIEEGFKTAGGMYNSMIRCGLAFDTPEALYAEKHMRAVAYMRPLSIWSMQAAWENYISR
ncbi:unnamed protein product [Psylliodes chrysocephalus]|uniref:NLGase n=1 Tax=Psylliodes chrysocephalus TaxID=3402493 RepID=A0A9P0DBQ5_9CUCU|nr:unnamed protein product [Psylliodes chrysocephala]